MKTMEVTKPSPNTSKPNKDWYTGCTHGGRVSLQLACPVTTPGRPGQAAHREKVVKEGEEPPGDVHGDDQREQDSTARGQARQGARVRAGQHGPRPVPTHQPLKKRLDIQLEKMENTACVGAPRSARASGGNLTTPAQCRQARASLDVVVAALASFCRGVAGSSSCRRSDSEVPVSGSAPGASWRMRGLAGPSGPPLAAAARCLLSRLQGFAPERQLERCVRGKLCG